MIVLNGELYTQRLQKLIFLYLSTGCFVKFLLCSSGHQEVYEVATEEARLMTGITSHFADVPLFTISRGQLYIVNCIHSTVVERGDCT